MHHLVSCKGITTVTQRLKVCRIATVPFALLGSKDHLETLQILGCEVTVVCSPDKNFPKINNLKVSRIVGITLEREIAPFRDFKSVIKLWRFFRDNDFDIIHSNTPKGGLLVALAGFLSRSSIVIHTFTGQRWATLNGFKRKLLMNCDRIIGLLNYRCFTDSHSQKEFLIEQKIVSQNKIDCIHMGAFSGIQTKRFFPVSIEQKLAKRAELGFDSEDFVIGFVGRLVGDKGIKELIRAFEELKKSYSGLRLLLVGPIEEAGDCLDNETVQTIKDDFKIVYTGLQTNPEEYLRAVDLFCLPSYREGFPTVVLEAAAMKIPAIVTDVVGAKDTVVDEETGLLIPAKDHSSLVVAINRFLQNPELIDQMGEKAYQRVLEDFTLDIIAKKNFLMYETIMRASK